MPTVDKDRNFSASGENTEEGQKKAPAPITFELGGETFTAKPFVQGIVIMDFLEASDGGGVSSVVAFKTFLKESLSEEEYTRLDNHLRTAEEEIDVKEISEGVGKLIQAFTSRPTKASAQ
jgi:hypothetical protein